VVQSKYVLLKKFQDVTLDSCPTSSDLKHGHVIDSEASDSLRVM